MQVIINFFKHQIKSFGFAFEGIAFSFKKGTHFKIHVIFAFLVAVLGFIFSISITQWLVIILIASAVLAAETANTAIEETCNVLHPEHHPGLKLAKHCAAGAVLILSIAAIIIGLLIFVPKILS